MEIRIELAYDKEKRAVRCMLVTGDDDGPGRVVLEDKERPLEEHEGIEVAVREVAEAVVNAGWQDAEWAEVFVREAMQGAASTLFD